jgi:hypothetical protein
MGSSRGGWHHSRRPGETTTAMIEVRSNAKDIAALFKEIASLPDKTARALQGVIGNALRKDVRKSIEGRGPIAVAPKHPISIQISAYRKQKNPKKLGGFLPGAIWSRRGNKGSVVVGPNNDRVAEIFRQFQTAESREFTDNEAISFGKAIRRAETGVRRVNSFQHAKYIADKYVRDRGLRLNRPARPIIEPLAKSPALAARLRKAALDRLNRDVKRAAAKAKAGAAE